MHKMIQVLQELGVDFNAKEHQHYKFTSNMANMPLVVETWLGDDHSQLVVSICHYGEMNGDAMRDPDVVFYAIDNEVYPISYRNDYVGVYQEARYTDDKGKERVDTKLDRELRGFLRQWAGTIKEQGFTRKVEPI